MFPKPNWALQLTAVMISTAVAFAFRSPVSRHYPALQRARKLWTQQRLLRPPNEGALARLKLLPRTEIDFCINDLHILDSTTRRRRHAAAAAAGRALRSTAEPAVEDLAAAAAAAGERRRRREAAEEEGPAPPTAARAAAAAAAAGGGGGGGDAAWPLPEGLAYDLYERDQSMFPEGSPFARRPVVEVADAATARAVLDVLYAHKEAFHACDTEVADIDLKAVGPVGHGRVTCVSIYSGPGVDFGLGHGPGAALWVENLGQSEGLLDMFKPWFEDESCKKVWHNYGFDRHVLYNMGIDARGFAGDTMHMARLWDAARDKTVAGGAGYSLESLTEAFNPERVKKGMKELFGVPRQLKSGEPSKVKEVPDVRTLQMHPLFRQNWIQYSAFDAEGTWLVHNRLSQLLSEMEWKECLQEGKTMLDYYEAYMRPFGELLTDMERNGIRVDKDEYLPKVQKQAEADREACLQTFKDWAAEYFPDAKYLNPASGAQIQTFLFGGANGLPRERTFRIDKEEAEIAAHEATVPQDEWETMSLTELKAACKEHGFKVSGTKAQLQGRLRGEEVDYSAEWKAMTKEELQNAASARALNPDAKATKTQLVKMLTEDSIAMAAINQGVKEQEAAAAAAAPQEKWSKFRDITVVGLGMTATKTTAAGQPATSADVLRKLAGDPEADPPRWGDAHDFFRRLKGPAEAERACRALHSLCKMGSIDTMISNFLVPLQTLADANGRVHCSLNLNTETGRLSARRPNLQNQPALEKDQYKIRQAFVAEPENALVVADYGQLELRLMSHMTNCASMLDAFEQGGCFHSRTAVGMFDYVAQAVEKGEVLLEWDESKGAPPAPLLKDVYGSERRKAKTLNFSIAYGKTPFGLSKDWGVSVEEAKQMLEAWYKDRPEVLKWQKNTIRNAKKNGTTRTLMGRSRNLPEINSSHPGAQGHSQRAAINTPIQGGAADVVMLGMLKIHRSEKLRELGYKLLLQVHDEVILEGPRAHRAAALAEVKACMEAPYDDFGLAPLRVKLTVDGKYANTWYEAK